MRHDDEVNQIAADLGQPPPTPYDGDVDHGTVRYAANVYSIIGLVMVSLGVFLGVLYLIGW